MSNYVYILSIQVLDENGNILSGAVSEVFAEKDLACKEKSNLEYHSKKDGLKHSIVVTEHKVRR